MSKYIFWLTIAQGILRDIFTKASNSELFLGVISGMNIAIAIKLLFEEES